MAAFVILHSAFVLPAHGLDAARLWRDPGFQRQLLGSYGFNAEVEPALKDDERFTHDKLVELIPSNPDGVVGAIRKLVTKDSSARFELLAGNVLAQKGQPEQAVGWYRRAVEKFPTYRTAWTNLGMNLVRIDRHAEGRDALTRAINLGASSAQLYGLLGYACTALEQWVPAESAYRQAIVLEPTSANWQLGLANVLFKQERFADAAALLQQLLREAPEKIEYWKMQANAYLALKRPLDAATNFEFIHRLGAETPETLNTLGDIYVNEGLLDLAARHYTAAHEKAPQAGVAGLLRAAEIFVARQGTEQARAMLAKVQDTGGLADADRKKLLVSRARIEIAGGTATAAVGLLEEAVTVDPLDGQTLLLLAKQLELKGDLEKAVFHLQRAENIEATAADARVRFAQLLVKKSSSIADKAEQTRTLNEAVQKLTEAQQINARDSVQKFKEELERFLKQRGR
jgi:tetratricopeptide (TPR) repeat protein